MHLVPIPTTHADLWAWHKHWMPFLPKIAQRSGESIDELFDLIEQFQVQIALVWDGEKAHALVGLRVVRRGNDLVGDIVWLTGTARKEWQHLLPDLERYLKEHCRCSVIRPICRPGWSRLIKPQGYRTTHYMMEKTL